MIEPRHPFERSKLHRFGGFPGGTPMNELRLVEAVDGFGERVVVGIALTADRGLDAGFRETLGVPNADVLRAPDALLSVKRLPAAG